MTPEAIMAPELTSSNSFRVEYRPEVTNPEMEKDLKSYIFEFRLRAQKYDYELSLNNESGRWRLGDPDRHEPMIDKAYRAVIERKARGESTHREEAELAGLTFLEQQLETAVLGDRIIWFSPPGPVQEGYGRYGFGFDGEVIAYGNGKKQIKMTATRFENPSIENYRAAFTKITGASVDGFDADDFLRMPVVLKKVPTAGEIEEVYARNFGFIFSPLEARQNNEIYEQRIQHLVNEFVANYSSMTNEEKKRSIHAMENIAAEAKRVGASSSYTVAGEMSLAYAMVNYGHEPEKVAGSCPVSKSNSPLSQLGENVKSLVFKLPEDKYGQREFNCPSCHSIVVRPKDKLLSTCPKCGSAEVAC